MNKYPKLQKQSGHLKRFELIFEKDTFFRFHYSPELLDKQLIVNFTLNKEASLNFISFNKNEKFPDNKQGRKDVCEIDEFTNRFKTKEEFEKYINKGKSYALFINTATNSFSQRLEPVFGNDAINNLLLVTEKDRILKQSIVSKIFFMLDNDIKFIDHCLYYNIRISSLLRYYLREYSRLKKLESNTEIMMELLDLKDLIKSELTNYINARQIVIEKEKYDLKNLKQEIIKPKEKVLEKKIDDGQIKFDGF